MAAIKAIGQLESFYVAVLENCPVFGSWQVTSLNLHLYVIKTWSRRSKWTSFVRNNTSTRLEQPNQRHFCPPVANQLPDSSSDPLKEDLVNADA